MSGRKRRRTPERRTQNRIDEYETFVLTQLAKAAETRVQKIAGKHVPNLVTASAKALAEEILLDKESGQ